MREKIIAAAKLFLANFPKKSSRIFQLDGKTKKIYNEKNESYGGDRVKRLLCALLAAVLLTVFLFPAYAVTPMLSESVPAPVMDGVGTEEKDGDITITIRFSAETEMCEQVRGAYLEKLLGDYTEDEIRHSNTYWLLYRSLIFCEISSDGSHWYTVPKPSENDGELKLSLLGDILPLFREKNEPLRKRLSGFNFLVRLVTASENYAAGDDTVFVLTAPSGQKVLSCPAFTLIEYSVPDDAVFPEERPEFFLGVTETDVSLPFPTRTGYTFAGWYKDGGGYTEILPAGTGYLRVTAKWTPKTYAINYVLATDITFNFGRANNTKNPTRYTVGEEAFLYDLESPVGGYTFDGWYYDLAFSGEKVTSVTPGTVGDVILYAKWISDEDRDARNKKLNEEYAASFHYGDLDFDGRVTAADARLALRASVNLDPLSAEAAKRADIYGTGIVSANTARVLLRISIGLDSLYTVLTFYGVIPQYMY